MLNRVMIIGRLGQDPQLKYSQTGSPIVTFSVATDEIFTDRDGIRQQRTEWFRVVGFAKTAENCAHYLHKGSLVYVEGSLQTRRWQDQQGQDHSLVEIRALRVDFLDKRGGPNEEYGRRGYEGENRQADYDAGPSARSAGTSYSPAPNHDPIFPQDAMGESAGSSPFAKPSEQTPEQEEKAANDSSEMDHVPF